MESRLRQVWAGGPRRARPEFEFGKRAANVDRGIRDHGARVSDRHRQRLATWRALDNDAWPAKYLFDVQGNLVRRWVGEGSYDEVESEIRRLLMSANPGVALPEMSREGETIAIIWRFC